MKLSAATPRLIRSGCPGEPDSWPAFLAWLLGHGWREYLKAVVLMLVITGAFELLGTRVMTNITGFIH
jgi:hypothetical protein